MHLILFGAVYSLNSSLLLWSLSSFLFRSHNYNLNQFLLQLFVFKVILCAVCCCLLMQYRGRWVSRPGTSTGDDERWQFGWMASNKRRWHECRWRSRCAAACQHELHDTWSTSLRPSRKFCTRMWCVVLVTTANLQKCLSHHSKAEENFQSFDEVLRVPGSWEPDEQHPFLQPVVDEERMASSQWFPCLAPTMTSSCSEFCTN